MFGQKIHASIQRIVLQTIGSRKISASLGATVNIDHFIYFRFFKPILLSIRAVPDDAPTDAFPPPTATPAIRALLDAAVPLGERMLYRCDGFSGSRCVAVFCCIL